MSAPLTLPSQRSRVLRPALLAVLVIAAAAAGFSGVRFALAVRALAARHATGPSWSFPSRVYSADLPLIPGAPMPASYLRAELEARGYQEVRGAPGAPGEWSTRSGGLEVLLRGFDGGPERVHMRFANARIGAIVRLGGLRGSAPPDTSQPPALEPVLLAVATDSARVWREWVPLARIPKALQLAVVCSEDRRFRSHWGLDLRGNVRALAANLRAGGVRQGASTITQQLARGLFLGNARTFGRKLDEMAIALGLEALLSKDQILEMYLNSVYFGRDAAGGIAGVGVAAKRFFGVSVEHLSLDQSALLVGMIPAPNLYSPFRRPHQALRRRAAVLHDMLEAGAIDAVTMTAASTAPLELSPTLPPAERFPSFLSTVRQFAARHLPEGALEGWGLSVRTSVDPVWQQQAEDLLAEAVRSEDPGRGKPLEGAFVLLDAPSGEIRALVGSVDPGPGEFNRATMALRQPGSAFKPVVYSAALDPRRGVPHFTPGDTIPDLRREFTTPEGPWQPKNDEGDYHPSVSLTKALAKSLNLATANLVERIGPATVSRYAERFGLGRPEAVASIGLGTHEVTLLALTGAYTVFANGGWRREPTPVREVRDAGGAVLALPGRNPIDVLPEATAALARDMLEDVVVFGISYPLRAEYGFTRPCGGKTGTTNDYHDAWFMGFTPELAAGVWVGYDTPRSLGAAAAKVALPVWAHVMNHLLEGFPATPFPARSDETLAWIDPWTGSLARRDCPSPLRVPFLKGTEPTTACTRDHTADWARVRAGALADSLDGAAADSAAAAAVLH